MPKAVLLLAASLFVAWLVIRSAAPSAVIRQLVFGTSLTTSPSAEVALNLAVAEMTANQGRISDATMAAVNKAALAAPLEEEGFVLHGVRRLAAGDRQAAERLFVEARARNPRSRLARLFLLDSYLRSGRVQAAAQEITVLSELIPAANGILLEELTKFTLDPQTRPAIRNALRSAPNVQLGLLEKLAQKAADPDLVMNLARYWRKAPFSEGAPWERQLLSSMVERGDVSRAYGLWRQQRGVAVDEKTPGIYDGSFKGLPGQPPFNWEFGTSGGAAERGPDGLQVEYYGRNEGAFATQLLMLPPGRKRLTFRVQGDASGDGSQLVWRITCFGSKARLLDLPLTNISYAGKAVKADFDVPSSGCGAQWLKLEGVSAEFPNSQSVVISDMRIAPVRSRG